MLTYTNFMDFIMKKFSIFLFITFFCTVFLNAHDKYWLVNEYLQLNPKQKDISKNFIDLVSKDAVKLSAKQEKVLKIVMVYPGNQISDYWRRSKVSFEKRLQALNIKYELKDYFTKPALEIKIQANQLLGAIKDNTDYLIFTLDASKHSQFIERILSRTKPKLILQNITTPVKKWGRIQPFLYVGFDHVIGSKILADYYLKETNSKGKYAVLHGTKGYVSYMRGNEFIDYVSRYKELELMDTYYTDFNKQKAINATNELLKTHNDLKFIYAGSTDIALGVSEVLKKNNLTGKILTNGWGGGSSELDAIEKGLLDITVMRMNDDNGVAMAEAIKLDLEDKINQVPTIFSGEFEVVKKGISKELLQKLKDKAFRYSN